MSPTRSIRTKQQYAVWIEQQYFNALIVFCVLAIIFHPAFHFILGILPDLPPDSLTTRLASAGVALAILILIWFFPGLRRCSSWLEIVNGSVALFVTHLLVFDSGNHPMYLAAALTSIYAAQLSFFRLREWLLTVGLTAAGYLLVAFARGEFASSQGYVAALFFAANYTIATALTAVRGRAHYREFEGRLALQQTNAELQLITDQLQNELALARDIQQSLLPPPAPTWPRLDVLCYSQPAQEVGGDFYSYHQFANGRVVMAVGDVSGKGVSAALLMATSISLLNEHLIDYEPPAELLENLDRSLLPYTQPHGYNCALCYIEIDQHTLYAVNAGGIAPYIRRASGTVEEIDVNGFALGHGLGATIGYQMRTCNIAPGDMVVMISDGVVEAKNHHGELFSFPRVEHVLAASSATSAQSIVNALLTAVHAFADSVEPHDDLTIVAMYVAA